MGFDEWQRLSPGRGRRWEPEIGVKKHNEKIHKESKAAEDKNLPFSFRKPKKPLGSSSIVFCPHCDRFISISSVTAAVICSGCGKFFKIDKE